MTTKSKSVNSPRSTTAGQKMKTVADRIRLSHLNVCKNEQSIQYVEEKHPELNETNSNIVRIVAQYLGEVGLKRSAEALVEESRCKIENIYAYHLRKAVEKSDWRGAQEVMENCRRYLPDRLINGVKLILLESQYFYHLSRKEKMQAFLLLRSEFPEKHRSKGLLTSALYRDVHALYRMCGQKFDEPEYVLDRLYKILPPSFMLRTKRLQSIFEQAQVYQYSQCPSHPEKQKKTEIRAENVLVDHHCGKNNEMSYVTRNVINESGNEVWVVQFSPCGKFLASGSKGSNVRIWKSVDGDLVGPIVVLDTIQPQTHFSYLSWSFDSHFLAVCGGGYSNYNLTVYNATDGTQFRVIKTQMDAAMHNPMMNFFTCCAFFAGTNRCLVAGNEQGVMKVYNMNLAEELQCMKTVNGFRVRCVYGFKDGTRFIASDSHNRLRLYSLESDSDETIITEETTVFSFTMHPSEKLVLTTTGINIRLWDIESRTLVRYFSGACQQVDCNKFIIQATFGGKYKSFIATGSVGERSGDGDDGRVCIWDVEDCRPILRLKGHNSMVNAVSWHPHDHSVLASCSEDGEIRIWNINRSLISKKSSIVSCKRRPIVSLSRNRKKKTRAFSEDFITDDELD